MIQHLLYTVPEVLPGAGNIENSVKRAKMLPGDHFSQSGACYRVHGFRLVLSWVHRVGFLTSSCHLKKEREPVSKTLWFRKMLDDGQPVKVTAFVVLKCKF
jgi:hypothetical protein